VRRSWQLSEATAASRLFMSQPIGIATDGKKMLRALLLCVGLAWPQLVEADSVLEILGKLKTFRDGSVSLLDSAALALKSEGSTAEAEKVQKWSDDWLSILGVNKGMTGLAKDFVVNYLGRSSYHDSNGRLIDAINKVSSTFPKSKDGFDEKSTGKLLKAMLDVCSEGMKVFKKSGSLHQMLSEFKDILKNKSNSKHFVKGLETNPGVRKAFDYFAGPIPSSSDEL
jgi:hypothetical protein